LTIIFEAANILSVAKNPAFNLQIRLKIFSVTPFACKTGIFCILDL
jgi:hypothetical protein